MLAPIFVFVFHATHILSTDVVVITCYAFLLSKHGINGFISCDATSRVVALLVAQNMPMLHSLVADIQLTSRAHLRF